MRIIIDEQYCQGCGICIHVCPKNIFQLSSKRSKRGYLMPEAVNEESCIQCGLCEKYCPDMCINVTKDRVKK
jgi:2-oxoglutarate ferredoxin oxidoreductase subunit delta